MMTQRIRLFGIEIDAVNMRETVDQLFSWVQSPQATCRYVVTPNADHAVMFQEHIGLRAAYEDASLVLADGISVMLAARLLRLRLPQRVAGSDLVPALFAAAEERGPIKVFLLGAGPGVADRAAKNIASRWPAVTIAGTCCPPLGFERDTAENERILAQIAAARPDVLIVGLGAPKQELWVHAHRDRIAASVALCAGATIDFLAGEKRRAPVWMRRAGLEWLHRLATEPRRLIGRYARDAWIFPQLICRELVTGARH
jgi:N-acetylglucosaminyldiphosphoundecaprenol N-acetyl-beta-D-mannosaminyltransferase